MHQSPANQSSGPGSLRESQRKGGRLILQAERAGMKGSYWLQQSKRPSREMEQAEFVLQSLFLVRPHPRSHYKLRVIVNRLAQEQPVGKDRLQYQFRFAAGEGVSFQQPYGSIVLLERPPAGPEERFLEIGKGDVDFNELLMQGGSEPALNGVIYGTRASNYDKVIAKYVYAVTKRRVEPRQVVNGEGDGRKMKFKDHVLKQRLPVLKLKQSILDRSNEINAKIRQLSESMALHGNQSQDRGKPEGPQFISKALKEEKNTKRMDGEQFYCFRLHEKVERLLAEGEFQQMNWLAIKSIKIFAQNIAKQPRQNILLKIHDRYHLRLIDIILKFQAKASSHPIDLLLPLPASTNFLSIDVTYQEQNWKTLQGHTRILLSITKTVELFSDSNEEQGFISLEVHRESSNSFGWERYQAQKADFVLLMKEIPSISSKPLAAEASRSRNPYPPLAYQSIERKKPISGFEMASRRSITEFGYREEGQSSRRKGVRRPKFSLQSAGLSSGESSHKALSLKIKNIYVHLYDCEPNGQLQLRFEYNREAIAVEVLNGYSDLVDSGPVLLTGLAPADSIKVSCYEDSSRSPTGSCSIGVQALIKSSEGQFKIFLARHDLLVGYISCEISLYRIKNNQIRALKKLSPSVPLYSSPADQFELSLSPQAVSHAKALSRPPARKPAIKLDESFLLEEQNFC